jgi:hypothetical protein
MTSYLNTNWTYLGLHGDAPPNSLRDPIVGPKANHWKKKRIVAHSLTHNTLGVGRCPGAPRWD